MGTNKLIQALVIIVIGLALLPIIVEFVDALDPISTPVDALVGLVPILYVILLVVLTIGFIRLKQ